MVFVPPGLSSAVLEERTTGPKELRATTSHCVLGVRFCHWVRTDDHHHDVIAVLFRRSSISPRILSRLAKHRRVCTTRRSSGFSPSCSLFVARRDGVDETPEVIVVVAVVRASRRRRSCRLRILFVKGSLLFKAFNVVSLVLSVSAAGTPVVDDFDHDGARDDADVLCRRHRCCCCCRCGASPPPPRLVVARVRVPRFNLPNSH